MGFETKKKRESTTKKNLQLVHWNSFKVIRYLYQGAAYPIFFGCSFFSYKYFGCACFLYKYSYMNICTKKRSIRKKLDMQCPDWNFFRVAGGRGGRVKRLENRIRKKQRPIASTIKIISTLDFTKGKNIKCFYDFSTEASITY